MNSATAWNNGQHHKSGAGYGLKISAVDRDRYIRREWGTVQLRIGSAPPIVVNVDKASFRNDTCRELISADLGRWVLSNGLAPWLSGQPPRFTLVPRELGGVRDQDIRVSALPPLSKQAARVPKSVSWTNVHL